MTTLNQVKNDGRNKGIIRHLNALEPILGGDSTIPLVPSLGVSGSSTAESTLVTLKSVKIPASDIAAGTFIKVNGIFVETSGVGTVDARVVFKSPNGKFKFSFWDGIASSTAQLVEGWLFIETVMPANGIATVYVPSGGGSGGTLRCTDWKTDSYITIEWQALASGGGTAYLSNFSVEVLKN